MRRRELLGTLGAVTATAVAGYQGTRTATASEESGHSHGHSHGSGGGDSDLAFMRNVEEVRGHLHSSVTLLQEGRTDDATLHAGHGADYYEPILTPLRDEDPELATNLRGHLSGLGSNAESMSASEYESYVDDEILSRLDDAAETVVDSETRTSDTFQVRLINALAGRIADEYSAAVPSAGTIELAGEYWDGRGFLTRIEERHESMSGFSAGGDTLDQLRSQIEAVDAASDVVETSFLFRIETAAGLPLPGAEISARDDAVTYLRNLEELRGHFGSSIALIESGNDPAATLHAGHGADYVTTLLPAVYAAEPDTATELLRLILDADDHVSDGASEYAAYINNDVLPELESVPSVAVPSEYRNNTAVSADVIIALAGRLEDEYTAAVTADEVIELYGEYWDARGFLSRIESRFADIESDLDAETRAEVEDELDILRTELETTATPEDVAGSVAHLTDELEDTTA